MPTTNLFFSQLRLLPNLSSSLSIMKLPTTTPFRSLHSSRTFSFFPFKFKFLVLRDAPFRATQRAFSARSESARSQTRRRGGGGRGGERSRLSSSYENPKSLVDDEAELSDWVDGLRTARVDSEFGESTRSRSRPSRDPVNSLSRNPRFAQRFNREFEGEDDELRTRKKRKGGELSRGGGKSARVRPQLKSVYDDDDDVVVGKGLKDFLSEEEEEEEGDESEGDEIVNKSRNALFGGTQKTATPRASSPSPGGSDSYLSETR